MKCPRCGAEISVRDEYCAWCGGGNDGALLHLQILRRYRERTEAARDEIRTQTLRRIPVFMRLLVIALLFVGFAVVFYIRNNAWEWEYNRKERESITRAAEYTKELDGLIEKRDSLGFEQFIRLNNINVYGRYGMDSPYRKYRHYEGLCADYSYIVWETMELYPFMDGGYSSESEEDILHIIADHTNNFYGDYERAVDDAEEPLSGEMLLAAEDMRDELEALLKVYIGLDDESVNKLADMTDAERKLAIERASR